MPMIEGEWYRVVFRASLAKWPKVPSFPELRGELVERIVMGADVVVYADHNSFRWEYGSAGPFTDLNFEIVEKLPSLTTSKMSFCKDKNGNVHMLYGARTEVMTADEAAALKAFL